MIVAMGASLLLGGGRYLDVKRNSTGHQGPRNTWTLPSDLIVERQLASMGRVLPPSRSPLTRPGRQPCRAGR